MKLENCKVGMKVKVKSLEKCEELGYVGHFASSFCGREVEILDIRSGKFRDKVLDYCSVYLKNHFLQSIPIKFLKKRKESKLISLWENI